MVDEKGAPRLYSVVMPPDREAAAESPDVVAIRRLKAAYITHLNAKDWPRLGELFIEEASVSYENGESQYEGRDAILDYLITSVGHLEALHVASNDRIELRGPDRAAGQWDLRFQWHDPWDNTYLRGEGTYFDEYVRTDDGWRISFTSFAVTES